MGKAKIGGDVNKSLSFLNVHYSSSPHVHLKDDLHLPLDFLVLVGGNKSDRGLLTLLKCFTISYKTQPMQQKNEVHLGLMVYESSESYKY